MYTCLIICLHLNFADSFCRYFHCLSNKYFLSPISNLLLKFCYYRWYMVLSFSWRPFQFCLKVYKGNYWLLRCCYLQMLKLLICFSSFTVLAWNDFIYTLLNCHSYPWSYPFCYIIEPFSAAYFPWKQLLLVLSCSSMSLIL